MSFAPLAFKLFYAARQNAVLRRSPFPPRADDDDARVWPRDVRGLDGAICSVRGPDPDAVAAPRRDPLPAAVPRVDRAGPRVRN